MRIWIDIGHPAQLNFYRNAIKELSKNNDILITVIDRGRLLGIARREFQSIENCRIIKVGRHSGTKLSAIFEANIFRLIKFYGFYFYYRPKIALGNGFLHGIIAKTFNFPSIMFGDDIERKLDVYLKTKFSTEIIYIIGEYKKQINSKILICNALKEWAYLSPKYFEPNPNHLLKYNVNKNEYIFIREVNTGTLNYHSQDKNSIAEIANKFPKGLTVLFSLEDKSTRHFYPEDWILLQEPIDDIHSLIYYSKGLLSSGDSMAREAAMLGVPSIYCGIRKMSANSIMINKGFLFHEKIQNVVRLIEEKFINSQFEKKLKIRENLSKEWIDVTELIISKVNNYKK